MGNRIMPLHFEPPNNSKESKDESKDDPKDEFDYIEEGQILLVARWVSHHHVFHDSANLISSWARPRNTVTRRPQEFLCLGLAMEC